LAVLRTNLDEASLSPKFHGAYDELTRRLREIVSDLRPPMLMYGLKPAIQELADNLMQRSGDSIQIVVEVQVERERYPQTIEQHLFRIVQEACENAMRHARAEEVRVSGCLNPHGLDLTIEDDGRGFDAQAQLDPEALLANGHYGMAGIVERASLIGAQLTIRSSAGAGTGIRVSWIEAR
jgi:signal transduction histidine kinase